VFASLDGATVRKVPAAHWSGSIGETTQISIDQPERLTGTIDRNN
jgi:hypothetical protein